MLNGRIKNQYLIKVKPKYYQQKESLNWINQKFYSEIHYYYIKMLIMFLQFELTEYNYFSELYSVRLHEFGTKEGTSI